MPKCPSKFCDYVNTEGSRYCSGCGMDLSLPEKEIKARDLLFEIFKELSKKLKLDIEITRDLIDHMIERHGASMMFQFLTALDGNKEKDETDKIELSKTGLYSIFLKRLKKLEKRPKEIIEFPKVFNHICSNFKMTKEECWDILFMLNEFKFIELIPFNGIKLLY